MVMAWVRRNYHLNVQRPETLNQSLKLSSIHSANDIEVATLMKRRWTKDGQKEDLLGEGGGGGQTDSHSAVHFLLH